MYMCHMNDDLQDLIKWIQLTEKILHKLLSIHSTPKKWCVFNVGSFADFNSQIMAGSSALSALPNASSEVSAAPTREG